MRADGPHWRTGDVIDGRYRVEGLLGRGGMGTVHRVRHLDWGVDLAMKSARPELLDGGAGEKRFIDEARLWVGLGLHPNVCTCHYVRTVDGLPLVFAEYLPGGSLAARIADRGLYAGEGALDRILDVAVQTAWGLEHAHRSGLVHQDVKPANVLLDGDGTVKLTDFGLARAFTAPPAGTAGAARDRGATAETSVLLTTGGMTPAYASPEQAAGRPVGRRSDVFAFAVAVLEMFTGGVTWLVGPAAGEALAAHRPGPGLPDLPAEVADLLARCLWTDPAGRPRSIGDVADALAGIRGRLTGGSRPAPREVDLRAGELNNRALSLLDLGQDDAAAGALRQALAVDPQHPAAAYNSALLAWRGGAATDEDILARLEGIRTDGADAPEVRELIARIHLERGDEPDGGGDARPLPWSRGDGSVAAMLFAVRVPIALSGSGGGTVRAVSGGPDGLVQVWDPDGARLIGSLHGHTGYVVAVDATPDGRRAISASEDGTVRVWDLDGARCLHVFDVPRPQDPEVPGKRALRGAAAALSADGRWAVWGCGGTYVYWDLRTGRHGTLATGWSGGGVSAAAAADRMVIELDLRLQIVDLSGDAPAPGRTVDTSLLAATCLSADGNLLVEADMRGAIRVHDLTGGRSPVTLRGHRDKVTALSLSADGRRLLSGGEDGTVRFWDVRAGRCLRTFRGHGDTVPAVLPRPADGSALSIGKDDTVRTWRLPRGHRAALRVSRPRPAAELGRAEDRVRELVAGADRALAGGRAAEALRLLGLARAVPGHERDPSVVGAWRRAGTSAVRTGLRGAWQVREFPLEWGRSLVPVGRSGALALGGTDGHIAIVDAAGTAAPRRVRAHGRDDRHPAVVRALAASDGGRLLSAGGDGAVRLWDAATLECLRTLPADAETIAFAGARAVTGGPDGIGLWDLDEGRLVRSVPVDGSTVRDLCCHRGTAFAARFDGRLGAWDLNGGRPLWEVASDARTVSVSSDGRSLLCCGGFGNELAVRDAATGEPVGRFDPAAAGEHEPTGARFFPDGRFAISSGEDGTVRVWDAGTGACLRVLEKDRDRLWRADVLPGGDEVFAWGADDIVRFWALDWDLAAPERAGA
ncbi:WD40 repeat domain-containing serine/threonine protein kinase [Actinomadura sp. WMMB 499]|uniref:WD40 repeat domain-containing serine/threonine protein kinase n=1 Tax=Actinomadura sp. WMMB 499 TaxID=1219491 RepID=UPI0012463403|nr:protein kinase [Actinomadura sp. WMMB 499]QFG22304.1 protein kinase [Actinomadura sp. WMMB 499]